MTPAEFIASERGQAAVEAMARALCAADGMDWDEARAPADPNVGTIAEAYAVAAEAALDVLLSPGEQPCPVRGGRGYDNSPPRAAEHYDMEPCPSCHGTGTVPGVPAIIDAVMERQTSVFVSKGEMAVELPLPDDEPVYRLRRPEETP